MMEHERVAPGDLIGCHQPLRFTKEVLVMSDGRTHVIWTEFLRAGTIALVVGVVRATGEPDGPAVLFLTTDGRMGWTRARWINHPAPLSD